MRLKIWHASMQFSDSNVQHLADANKLFKQAKIAGVAWVTGTETGPGAGNLGTVIKAAALANGFLFYTVGKTDNWLAISRNIATSKLTSRYSEVSPGKAHLHASRGVLSSTFTTDRLGTITVGTGHLMTKGARPGDPFYAENTRYTKAIGDWARRYGTGRRLVFYGGDQNIGDRTLDTFRGQPLTSCWDELKKWPSTGHGTIDVIASYNLDTRVQCRNARAFDDKAFFLHSDHFLIEAIYEVTPL